MKKVNRSEIFCTGIDGDIFQIINDTPWEKDQSSHAPEVRLESDLKVILKITGRTEKEVRRMWDEALKISDKSEWLSKTGFTLIDHGMREVE